MQRRLKITARNVILDVLLLSWHFNIEVKQIVTRAIGIQKEN